VGGVGWESGRLLVAFFLVFRGFGGDGTRLWGGIRGFPSFLPFFFLVPSLECPHVFQLFVSVLCFVCVFLFTF